MMSGLHVRRAPRIVERIETRPGAGSRRPRLGNPRLSRPAFAAPSARGSAPSPCRMEIIGNAIQSPAFSVRKLITAHLRAADAHQPADNPAQTPAGRSHVHAIRVNSRPECSSLKSARARRFGHFPRPPAQSRSSRWRLHDGTHWGGGVADCFAGCPCHRIWNRVNVLGRRNSSSSISMASVTGMSLPVFADGMGSVHECVSCSRQSSLLALLLKVAVSASIRSPSTFAD